ncbi:hypothetical protein [Cysteiniphilum marinum]|nr:hypothetical protein [Cysteiniphilum marinum]
MTLKRQVIEFMDIEVINLQNHKAQQQAKAYYLLMTQYVKKTAAENTKG